MIASLVIASRKLSGSSTAQATIFSSEPQQSLEWLAARLRALGLITDGSPVTKNAAALVDVTVFEQRYRLKSMRDDCSEQSTTVRLQKRVRIVDRLLGRDTFDANDAFVRVLQDVLEREAFVDQVNVTWS